MNDEYPFINWPFIIHPSSFLAPRGPSLTLGALTKDAMTLLDSTMVLYLVVGVGVAAAVYLSGSSASRSQTGVWERDALWEQDAGLWLRMAMAIPFWPLYLPILLSAPKSCAEAPEGCPSQPSLVPKDDMSAAIAQVDAELEAALNSLDGWAEDVLARERDRIRELRDAWNAQASRVREMDRLLSLPQYTSSAREPESDQNKTMNDERGMMKHEGSFSSNSSFIIPHSSFSSVSPAKNRLAQSQEACQANIKRLGLVRQRTYDDLLSNLAWVRELVSMIHLAKFTGAPASRAEELVAQIAAAVEGLSDLTWREEATVAADGNISAPE